MRGFTAVLSMSALLAAGAAMAGDSQYHFKVKNATSAKLTKLEVSEDKKSWGEFDVGDGIAAGTTETMVWDESTDSESCTQWMRAKFSDGGSAPAQKFDFCKDMDVPIEFSE